MHLKRLGPVALLLLAACDDSALPAATTSAPAPLTAAPSAAPSSAPVTPPALPAERRTPQPMPGGGVRLDMSGQSRHVRGLQRQPDGTWKSVCTDDPEGLRPRASGEGAR
jgi:hypothetical protein